MKLNTLIFIFAGALSLGATACATTEKAAASGVDSATKELGTTGSDAKKGADYVEGDVKKETGEKKE